MKYVLLNPITEDARLVSAEIYATFSVDDLGGYTVLEVADDFSWYDKAPDFVTLDVVDDHSMELAALRFERDRLLRESDKVMLSDYPITELEREDWVEYRQALRDLPEIAILSDLEIVWPDPPS